MRTAWCVATLVVAFSACTDEVQGDWERRADALEAQVTQLQALLALRPQTEARFEAAASALVALRPVTPAELRAVLGDSFTVEVQSGLSFQVLVAHGPGPVEAVATALERGATLEPRLTPTAVERGPQGWTLLFTTGSAEGAHLPTVPVAPVLPCTGGCVAARARAVATEQTLGALQAQAGRLAMLESVERLATHGVRNRASLVHPFLPAMLAVLRSGGEAPAWAVMRANRAELRLEVPTPP